MANEKDITFIGFLIIGNGYNRCNWLCYHRERYYLTDGTIKFVDLEGGFYGIVGDDGKNYEVSNLSQGFQVDGLRVQFEAKLRKGVATIHMWGIPVEITKIESCEP